MKTLNELERLEDKVVQVDRSVTDPETSFVLDIDLQWTWYCHDSSTGSVDYESGTLSPAVIGIFGADLRCKELMVTTDRSPTSVGESYRQNITGNSFARLQGGPFPLISSDELDIVGFIELDSRTDLKKNTNIQEVKFGIYYSGLNTNHHFGKFYTGMQASNLTDEELQRFLELLKANQIADLLTQLHNHPEVHQWTSLYLQPSVNSGEDWFSGYSGVVKSFSVQEITAPPVRKSTPVLSLVPSNPKLEISQLKRKQSHNLLDLPLAK